MNVHAQTKPNRYMLCVGINNYSGDPKLSTFKTWDDREIKNLHGCLNDVDTISKLFQKYYQFDKANIVKLLDQQASRNAIMDSLKSMAARCRKGDYFVFFYSGHGSTGFENNNQTTAKGYRNTIVPANAKDKNVYDIDNVEFNALFLNFIKKGVKLTVITDCCHSGTNTRGATLFEADSSREVESAPPHTNTVIENIHTIRLDSLGALTIGACQDNQESKETTVSGKAYGAFCISFCKAITEWPMASAENLYERTLAKIGLIRKEQNPNMEGSKRLNLDIIGSKEGEYRRQAFPLYQFDHKPYEIKGGFLDGLMDGDILVEQKSKDSIRILAVLGPSNASFEFINQSKTYKFANGFNAQFSVLNLVSNTEPPLKIFLGNGMGDEQLKTITAAAKDLFQNKNINWMIPSVKMVPEAVLFYKADTVVNGQWKLNRNKSLATKNITDLKSDELISLLNKKNVYLQLPHENSLTESITKKLAQKINRNIKLVHSIQQADYVLAGHLVDSSKIEYGWENTHLNDSTTDLPIATDFFPLNGDTNNITDSLMNRLTILSKLAYWLSIETPIKDSSLRFPYSISIKNITQKNKPDADRKTKMRADMPDLLEINFVEDKYTKIKWDTTLRLFIYLFSMDPKGNMNLIFPQPRTTVFDYPWIKGEHFEPSYLATVKHTSPGKYHYFLLACKDQVINRSVFNQHGVKRSADTITSNNPLEILMSDNDSGQRGEIRTFGNWLLKRVDIITEDKNGTKK